MVLIFFRVMHVLPYCQRKRKSVDSIITMIYRSFTHKITAHRQYNKLRVNYLGLMWMERGERESVTINLSLSNFLLLLEMRLYIILIYESNQCYRFIWSPVGFVCGRGGIQNLFIRLISLHDMHTSMPAATAL